MVADPPAAYVGITPGEPALLPSRAADGSMPRAGRLPVHYDQLGSGRSDQPDDSELYEIDRFVDEVEQVRRALGLDRESFFLMGHLWGGLLAIEYALAHRQHLKRLVISNMTSSIPAYNRYAEKVLMPSMDQDALAEIKRLEEAGETETARYEELLNVHHKSCSASMCR